MFRKRLYWELQNHESLSLNEDDSVRFDTENFPLMTWTLGKGG